MEFLISMLFVVRATTEALLKSNPTLMPHFSTMEMLRSWVQLIYRRMGLCRRLGTTGRPPVPRGMYEECRLDYLRDIDSKIKVHSNPHELMLNADQTPNSYVSWLLKALNLFQLKVLRTRGTLL